MTDNRFPETPGIAGAVDRVMRAYDNASAQDAERRKVAYTHRIRRCKGNRNAWCLVALRDDGTEIDGNGDSITAMTIDDLLRRSRGLLPSSDDVVQIVYYDEAAQ